MKKFVMCIITAIAILLTVITAFETKAVDKEVEYEKYEKYYTEYQIKKGDTLSEICYDIYYSSEDNQNAWESYKDLMNEIIVINQMNKFDIIHAGDYLTLVYTKVK